MALAAVLGLVGAVVAAHSVVSHAHIGDVGETVVTCLAVAQTAVIAAGAALAPGATMRRPLWLVALPPLHGPTVSTWPVGIRARAGPMLSGVLRL